jgi:hypothetical protein
MGPRTNGGIRLPLVFLATALMAACGKSDIELELITPSQPLDQIVAEQIVALVEEDSGVRIRLIPPPADGTPILDALRDGYGDLAFAPNSMRYQDGISTILPLYPTVLHIATRLEAPPETFRDLLADAVIFAGAAGSIPRILAEDIASELELENVQFVDEFDPSSVDVIIVYAPIDRERVMTNTQLDNFRLFSLGDPHDVGRGSSVDGAVLLNPRLRPFIIPIDTYGRLTPEPIVTLAVDKLLVAREDLDDAVVYDIFAEILRIRPTLFGERPELFQPLDENVSRSNWAFSMHPGSIAFLQRDEPTFIERYSGVGEVLVALIAAFVSGTFAMVRIYRVRRKNRIDKFYTKVIQVRDHALAAGTGESREAAIAEIRQLQNTAYEQLVDEKLAADESFRIFIELTNDSLGELRQPDNV